MWMMPNNEWQQFLLKISINLRLLLPIPLQLITFFRTVPGECCIFQFAKKMSIEKLQRLRFTWYHYFCHVCHLNSLTINLWLTSFLWCYYYLWIKTRWIYYGWWFNCNEFVSGTCFLCWMFGIDLLPYLTPRTMSESPNSRLMFT